MRGQVRVHREIRRKAAGAAASPRPARREPAVRPGPPEDTRALIRDHLRLNAVWREHLRALLDEQERAEEHQRALMAESPAHAPKRGQAGSLAHMVEDYERVLILWALASVGGHQVRAAALLGVGRTTLNEKIKRLKIPVPKREAPSRTATGSKGRRH